MTRFIAKFIAKRQYIFKLECEAATHDINAQLAANRAQEKRAFIDQLNKETDDIDANITREEATDEYKALAGQEKDDARKMATEKRRQSEEEAKNVSEGEKTAQYLRGMAQNSRVVADKIRYI